MKNIKETTYSLMFDRIEAGTYLVAAALTQGNLKIKKVVPKIIQTEIDVLKKIGAKIITKKMKSTLLEVKKLKI